MAETLEETLPAFNINEPFPENAQKFLNALYSSQESPPKTDEEKTSLLRTLADNLTIDGFEGEQEIRKAHEYGFLVQKGLIYKTL